MMKSKNPYQFKVFLDTTRENFYIRTINASSKEEAEEDLKAVIDVFRCVTLDEDTPTVLLNVEIGALPIKFTRQFPYIHLNYIDNSIDAPLVLVTRPKGDKSGLIDVPEGVYLYELQE